MPTERYTCKNALTVSRGWTFGSNLERVMLEKRIRKSELAQRTQVTPAAVSHWVQDKTVPSSERVIQIAAALDVPVMALLSPELTSDIHGPVSVLPEVLDLPEFGMDWAMSQDENGENVFRLDERKAKLGRWRVPAEVIRDHASVMPRPVVVRVQGNAMAPEFAAGDYVIVDLGWKDVSPPGVYLIGEALRLTLRRCERLLGDKSELVRVSTAQGWTETEMSIAELERDILGRVIFRLTTPV